MLSPGARLVFFSVLTCHPLALLFPSTPHVQLFVIRTVRGSLCFFGHEIYFGDLIQFHIFSHQLHRDTPKPVLPWTLHIVTC